MILLIMAAGSGSRYGKLKQFDGLGPNGEFLMEYSIYDAIKSGFNHMVIITKSENKDFLFNYLRNRINKSIKIDVISQEISNLPKKMVANPKRKKPWGTAHAVWSAKEHIKENFAIINADDYYGAKAFEKAADFLKNSISANNYGIVTYLLKNTLSKFGSVSRGVCEVKDKKLIAINEYLSIEKNNEVIKDLNSGDILNEKDFVSMNFWLCNSSFFSHLEEYIQNEMTKLKNIEKDEIYLPFAAQNLLFEKKISIDVVESNSNWFGITYKEDKKESSSNLKKYIDRKFYPKKLW